MVRSVHEFDPDIGPGGIDSQAQAWFDAFRLSKALRDFTTRNEAGAYLVEKATAELQGAINTWLTSDDPRSQEAIEAHFRAVVAVKMLNNIEDAIQSGREAEAALGEMEASGEG